MSIFKKSYTLRRYTEQQIIRGMISAPYTDMNVRLDIQTLEDAQVTTQDGTVSVQQIKSFGKEQVKTEDVTNQVKADRLYFQGKWFECKSSRLSENTPLKHWTATFIELLDGDFAPGGIV